MQKIDPSSIIGRAFSAGEQLTSSRISDQPARVVIDRYSDLTRLSSVQETPSYSLQGDGIRFTTALSDGSGGSASSAPDNNIFRNRRMGGGLRGGGTIPNIVTEYRIDADANLHYKLLDIGVTGGRIMWINYVLEETIAGKCVFECGTGAQMKVVGGG